jgi:hypothetical protein
MKSIISKKNIAPVIAYVAAPFVYLIGLHNHLIGASRFLDYDISTRILVSDLIRNLEFPFLNPYIFGTFPLFESPNTMLYPPVILLDLLLPIPISYNLNIILHIAACGILMYFLIKRSNMAVLASFIGGLVFMLSGILVTMKSNSSVLFSSVWVIAACLSLQKFRQTKRASFVFIASLCYGLVFLGGSLHIFYTATLLIAALILYFALLHEGRKNAWFLLSLLSLPLGLAIVSFKFIPTLFHLKESFALHGASVSSVYSAFGLRATVLFFSPFIFGSQSGFLNTLDYYGQGEYWSTVIYFGVSAMTLAILGMVSKKRTKYLWVFLWASSFFVVIAINHLFKNNVFAYLNIDTAWWFVFGFSLAILCALGIDHIGRGHTSLKKPAMDIAGLYIGMFLLFFIVYACMKTDLREPFLYFMEMIGLAIERPSHLAQTLRFDGWAVTAPLIVVFFSAIALIVFYQKRKVLLLILSALLVFDLFSFALFFEDSSKKSVYTANAKIQDMPMLVYDDANPYRIYQATDRTAGMDIRPNNNSISRIASLRGYVPYYMQEDNILKRETSAHTHTETALIQNNHILSAYSVRYVVLPAGEESEDILLPLERVYYKEPEHILSPQDMADAEMQGAAILEDKTLIIGKEAEGIKIISIPILLESDCDYIISFEIKATPEIKSPIHFDYFGAHYDRDEQEFFLTPGEIGTEFEKIERVLHSGMIPEGTEEVFFRVFTYSSGQFAIRDLQITKSNTIVLQSYAVAFSDEQSTILENMDHLPPFYFTPKVYHVPDAKRAKERIWEEGVYWEQDRFDPKEATIVIGADFEKKEFSVRDTDIEIIKKTNNRYVLRTKTEDESFLVCTNTNLHNWRAAIDGEETRIYLANAYVMGILIPKGTHHIEFVYMPQNLLLYSIISAAALLLIVIVIIVLRKKEAKSLGETKEKKK